MSTLAELNADERMLLLRFVCTFAWADLEIDGEERLYVGRLVDRLHLEPDECKQVRQWLKVPPAPEEVDPQEVPIRHRQLFLDAIQGVVAADLDISGEERESVELLRQMIGD